MAECPDCGKSGLRKRRYPNNTIVTIDSDGLIHKCNRKRKIKFDETLGVPYQETDDGRPR